METLVISKNTIKQAYNPQTAFGNVTLIKAIEEARKEEEEKAKKEQCKLCDTWGEVDVDCENCDGRGHYSVKCDHEGGHL